MFNKSSKEIKQVFDETRKNMGKSIDYFKSQLAGVRTGRASSSLVEKVRADYYGQQTELSQMATISVPDARTIVIQPWDRNSISTIEKAIQAADLGFNPHSDGTVIRISVPPLTEERRKEMVKLCKKYAEETRVAVRNLRRDAIDMLKKMEKAKEISEDDLKRGTDEIQKKTDSSIKDIDKLVETKEKELMD